MCCAFPSLFVLLGSAFLRSFRCILSISVPCANFTSASVRAIGLTLIPSLSSGTIIAAFHAFISWCPCFPFVHAAIHAVRALSPPSAAAIALMWLFLSPLGPSAAPALSTRIRLLTAPVVISGTLLQSLFASFLAPSSSLCSSVVTSIAIMFLTFSTVSWLFGARTTSYQRLACSSRYCLAGLETLHFGGRAFVASLRACHLLSLSSTFCMGSLPDGCSKVCAIRLSLPAGAFSEFLSAFSFGCFL